MLAGVAVLPATSFTCRQVSDETEHTTQQCLGSGAAEVVDPTSAYFCVLLRSTRSASPRSSSSLSFVTPRT